MKNIGVFVDVSDFYYRVRRKFSGAKLNYSAYIDVIAEQGRIFRAIAYCMQVETEAHGFIKYLRANDFDVRDKRPRTIKIGERAIKQCDWGVGLTIDVVSLLERLDTVVLGISNPDYIPLVQWLRDQGKEVIIFASCIPQSLRDSANSAIEIGEDLLQE